MFRQLLTLLAVISGLTLVAEPARALGSDIVSIAEAADNQSEIKGVSPDQALSGAAAQAEQVHVPAHLQTAQQAPAVILQADRAHE